MNELKSVTKRHTVKALQDKMVNWQSNAPSDAESETAMYLLKNGTEESWNSNASYGILSMSFDPETQDRKHVVINSCLSRMTGMHKEELLARLASHDLDLPLTQLDTLRVMLYMTLRCFAVPGLPRVKYLRFCVGQGVYRRCVLMCWCSFSVVGPDDKVTEVLIIAISPHQLLEIVNSRRAHSWCQSNLYFLDLITDINPPLPFAHNFLKFVEQSTL
jgi:hypothetical protein